MENLPTRREPTLEKLKPLLARTKKRRWQFWYALRGVYVTTSTTNPTLFEVVWLPFLLTLYKRGPSAESDLYTNTARLWEYWKSDNLPWRLRAQVEQLRFHRLRLWRENSRLRRERDEAQHKGQLS